MQKKEELLLALLRTAIDMKYAKEFYSLIPLSDSEWIEVGNMTSENGVVGLVYSQLEKLFSISDSELSQIIGHDVEVEELKPSVEFLYSLYLEQKKRQNIYMKQLKTAVGLAKEMARNGIEMKILKGISFSTYYDMPAKRECGDCDCYLTFKDSDKCAYEEGNEVARKYGAEVEFGTYKHSHITVNDVMFENHHYMTDFNGTKRGKDIERLLESVINSEPGHVIGNTGLVCPCNHFNALFLLKHAQANFINSGVTLRIIYDWVMLVRKEQDNMDWNSIKAELSEHKLLKFAEVMTAVAKKFLGLEITNHDVPCSQDESMAEKFMIDTLRYGNHIKKNETFALKVNRILKRYWRMWQYKDYATESFGRMILNSFAFSSYLHRNISLD